MRVDADGDQSTEELLARDADNRPAPKPISMGPESDRLVLVLFGTGLRNGEVRELRIGSVHLPSNDVSTLFLGPSPGFLGLDQVNSGILPRRLEDFGGGLRDIRIFAGPQDSEDVSQSNIVRIAFAPNPDAPVLTGFSLGGAAAEDGTTEVEIGYSFIDADGDLGPMRLHLMLTGSVGFCLSRIEDRGEPGETEGARQFSVTANSGEFVGEISRADLSVRDEAGRSSAFYRADALDAQGDWRVPCSLFIPRRSEPGLSLHRGVLPASVREVAEMYIWSDDDER